MFRPAWWSDRHLITFAVIAAAVPLLWPHIPPLTDLPGHMASYHVSVSIAHSAALRHFFTFDWQLIGNLGVDLLVVPLSALFGVEVATKMIVVAIPTSTALALMLLARQANGRLPATALAAVPLVYNDPFLFGFVNYSLAAALALFGLLWWQRWPSDIRPGLRLVTFALVAAAVWLAHAIGWVMLGAMCGAAELHRRLAARDGHAPGNTARALMKTAVACLGLASPLILMRLGPHADHGSTNSWLWIQGMFWSVVKALRDRWSLWDAASVAVLIALVSAAMLRTAGLRFAPSLAWPALALLGLFICLPTGIDGSFYVNTRIVPYALALGVVAIDTAALTHPRQAMLAFAAALFCAARLIGNTASFYIYDASYTRELAAIDHLPHGAAVLTLVEMSCNPGLKHRLEHVPGLATVRRDAFVNVLWTIKGLQLLRDHVPQMGSFREDPSEFVAPPPGCVSYPSARTAFATAPLKAFSHVWLIGVPAAERPHDPRLVPVWAAGQSILYRITRDVPRASAVGLWGGSGR
jgi:hypothetical protein